VDDDLRGLDASEGIRIIGASEAAPGVGAPAAPLRRDPAAGSWEDDEGSWDDEWISGDGDLDDPDHTGNGQAGNGQAGSDVADSEAPSRAPARRVTIDDDRLPGDDGRDSWRATQPAQGPRWRADGDDWDDAYDDGDIADWADGADGVAVGTLDPNRAESSDLYSLDDIDQVGSSSSRVVLGSNEDLADSATLDPEMQDFADDFDSEALPLVGAGASRRPSRGATGQRRPESLQGTKAAGLPAGGERTVGRAGARRSGGAGNSSASNAPGARRANGPASRPVSSSLGMRVITGVALVAVFGIIMFLFKARGAVALVSVVLAFAVFEFFTALRQRGFQPAILPGALATLILPVVAFNKGAEGLLIALVLTTLTTLLWFLFGVVRDRPAVNIAVTVMGVLMIGLLGGVSGLILRAPNGLGIFVSAILVTAAYDIFGYFVGANLGQRPLAPDISPNKTVEGLAGGMIGAIIAAILIGVVSVKPWTSTTLALSLGVLVAIMAPLGDLTESMIKRDLGLKDMGTILPGHGGVLDRIDAMIFSIPAVFFLARWKGWV
jgi:phosphatidate cytidylyltransferase